MNFKIDVSWNQWAEKKQTLSAICINDTGAIGNADSSSQIGLKEFFFSPIDRNRLIIKYYYGNEKSFTIPLTHSIFCLLQTSPLSLHCPFFKIKRQTINSNPFVKNYKFVVLLIVVVTKSSYQLNTMTFILIQYM